MIWFFALYYLGYALALWLCWNLGQVFRVPMLLNLAFDVCLKLGFFEGWDIRIVIVSYGLAFFFWVLALSQSLTKSTFAFVLLLDLVVAYKQMFPKLAMVGNGTQFWFHVSTDILQIWMASIATVVGSMLVRGTIVARLKGRRVDVWTNPKKRFQLPIGLWALTILFTAWFKPQLPPLLAQYRFLLAANLLVWGWALLELPHYLANRRLMREEEDDMFSIEP